MAKFDHDARELLELVGGKDNIAAASHCMTRMRFALKDPSKADVAAIEKLASVKGSFTQAGQFQVIIGNDVADFYDTFVGISGVSEASKQDVKSAALQNTNILQRAMGAIAEVFAPLIPCLARCPTLDLKVTRPSLRFPFSGRAYITSCGLLARQSSMPASL